MLQFPYHIGHLLSVVVQQHGVGRFQPRADGGNFQIGQHSQQGRGSDFQRGRLVTVGQSQHVSTQRIDAEVEQSIVAAEKGQIAGAPVIAIIRAGAVRRDVGHVEQP